jgi:hypothetical protein
MTASDQRDRSSRVEREIQEILERAEAKQSPVDNLQAAMRRQATSTRERVTRASAPEFLLRSINAEVVRIAGALLLAVIAAGIAGTSHVLAVLFAIAGALVFFSLWFPSRSRGVGEGPRWRGQDLRDQGGSSPFGRGRNWPKRPSG